MLYSTNGQLIIFIVFLLLGGTCFLTFKILITFENKIRISNKNLKKFIFGIIDVTTIIIFAFVFITINTLVCYGELRLFIIISFFIGVATFYYAYLLFCKKQKNK